MKLSDLVITDIGNTIEMVGSIYADTSTIYLCYFPGDKCAGPVAHLDMDVEDWQKFLYQSDVLETMANTQDKNGTITKAIVRKSQRQIDQHVMWKCFRRDSYTCRYCGKNDTPLTVDHLIPWEDGGPSTENNLLTACKRCNKARGNTPFQDWLKSSYYLEKSIGLLRGVDDSNNDCAKTLDKIRRVYVRSR